MSESSRLVRTLVGFAEAVSPTFSNEWRLIQGDRELAVMRRFPRNHLSKVKLADDTVWSLEPDGWGTVRAYERDVPFAEIVRRSWWGRRWQVSSIGFAGELISRPRPRRWKFAIGGEPIADLSGSAISYNHIGINAQIALPLSSVLLAWQVIARPWEAAAYPTQLVPAPQPEAAPQPRPETA